MNDAKSVCIIIFIVVVLTCAVFGCGVLAGYRCHQAAVAAEANP